MSYDDYRQMTLRPEKDQCKVSSAGRTSPMLNEEDELPILPWSIRVPSAHGNTRIVHIPKDVDMQTLEIPPRVQQDSTATANRLLQMVAGMQYLLIDIANDARYDMIDSSWMIDRPRYQLVSMRGICNWVSCH